jgi:hypothetical protein
MTVEVRGAYGRQHGLNDSPSPLTPPMGHVVAATDVCRRADITYRQLDYWCATYPDYMPIAVPAEGSGSNRWYHAADIPKYHVLGRLTRMNLQLNKLLKLDHQQRLRLCGVMRKLWQDAGDRQFGGPDKGRGAPVMPDRRPPTPLETSGAPT